MVGERAAAQTETGLERGWFWSSAAMETEQQRGVGDGGVEVMEAEGQVGLCSDAE